MIWVQQQVELITPVLTRLVRRVFCNNLGQYSDSACTVSYHPAYRAPLYIQRVVSGDGHEIATQHHHLHSRHQVFRHWYMVPMMIHAEYLKKAAAGKFLLIRGAMPMQHLQSLLYSVCVKPSKVRELLTVLYKTSQPQQTGQCDKAMVQQHPTFFHGRHFLRQLPLKPCW